LIGTQLRQASTFPGYRNRLSQLANLTVDLDAGFAKLISSSSYQWGREDRLADFSAFLVPAIATTLGVVPRDAKGQAGSPFFASQKSRDFTQEVRLVSSGDGPFNWIVGGFYNKSKNLQNQDVQLRGITALLGIPNDNYALTFLDDRLREISFFGEVGYKFSDTLSANFGIRHYDIALQAGGFISGLLAGGGTNVTLPVKSKENGFTYKAGIKYKPNTNLMVFANYATGYRPGGTNTPGFGIPAGFKSDKLAQYELGMKSSWLDQTLSVNSTVFYIDWSDIPTVVVTPAGLSYNINGPKARNYGAELEVVMRPTKGFDVSFGLTVLNAKYAADFTDTTAKRILIKKGDRLPNVPDITLNAALNYVWSIGDNAKARIGANVSHVTKRSQSINETVSLLPGLVNAGMSAGVDFGKFDVSVFVRNVFDTRALVGNFAIGNDISNGVASSFNRQSFLQPRTIGASVQVKF
jgi:iron complex outermembrane recepter protein